MPSEPFVLDRSVCGDFDQIRRLEWLETNGLGGFAASTVAGINTRRYHGLLTASLHPPVGRYVLLSKVEETAIIGGIRYDLSANFYPGAIHPQGHRLLREFRLRPFPVFVYDLDGIQIEKRVFMPHGENTVVVEWQVRAPGRDCLLEVRPLMAFRDYHSLTHANGALNPALDRQPGMISFQPYRDLPRLYMAHNANEVETGSGWYYSFELPVERERGLDYQEDLFSPLVLRFDLTARGAATLIASTNVHRDADALPMRLREERRRERIAAESRSADPLITALTQASEQYIVQRGEGKTIVAGYHWFSDWGRDTMIALPGLTLATGRYGIARDILIEFSKHVSQGMLPNRFPDSNEDPEYNTVDATLWYFEAIRAYRQQTGDDDTVRTHLYPVLKDIVSWHLKGTRYGIRMDDDGLLAAGAPGVQLTWMDAKIGDWVVTPRHGKPVEIQALWYNALRVLAEFAVLFGDLETQPILMGLADRARESFNAQFWNEQARCFYDVVNGPAKDPSIRPNQVIALSLPYIMPSPRRARAALAVVERELVTPAGLRTLAPSDPSYAGTYSGGPAERDALYHQGTVWPWLLGHFVTAYVTAHDGAPAARRRMRALLDEAGAQLRTLCLGQFAEIFDGDAPHRPRGCCAQAWSVAEILRAAVDLTAGCHELVAGVTYRHDTRDARSHQSAAAAR